MDTSCSPELTTSIHPPNRPHGASTEVDPAAAARDTAGRAPIGGRAGPGHARHARRVVRGLLHRGRQGAGACWLGGLGVFGGWDGVVGDVGLGWGGGAGLSVGGLVMVVGLRLVWECIRGVLGWG